MLFNPLKRYNLSDYRVILTDFDGVLTDNKVLVTDDGKEAVKCSRSDGLAFDHLRCLNFPTYILSSETNAVVNMRAKKLNVKCRQSLKNKVDEIRLIIKQISCTPDEVIYVGNDINDLGAISFCGLTFCPSDSHPLVKKKANVILNTAGGQGVFREILEHWFKLNITFKYLKEASNEY